jgi:hypothetical protein
MELLLDAPLQVPFENEDERCSCNHQRRDERGGGQEQQT